MSLVGELPAILACYALTRESALIPQVFPVPRAPFSQVEKGIQPSPRVP